MLRIATSTLFSDGALNIDTNQSAMLATQLQLSTGKQINAPSDNPGGAAEVASLEDQVGQLAQFASNQSQATSVLNQGQGTLQQFNNALQTARESLVAAGNGSYTDSERADLASSLQGVLGQLMTLANTSDGSGGYLFAGSKQSATPFTQTGTTFSYQGDSLAPSLEVATNRSLQTKYTGDSVFMKIPQGNGSFVTAAAATNTGSGVVGVGSVTNAGSLTGDNYTISIAAAGSGLSYTVKNTTTNTQVSTGTYSDPTTLAFDGMSIDLGGAPQAGDTFTVAPAGNQSIFATIQQAITALQTPASGGTGAAAAQFTTTRLSAMASLDQAMNHISVVQASMGSQIDSLNAYKSVNSEQSTDVQTRLSDVQDLDYAKAASSLSQQQLSYQAALQSYSMVSKLSLFNYM